MEQEAKTEYKDLDINNKPEIKRKIEELVEETWLSRREAEVSILMNETDNYEKLSQLADDLNLSHNTVYAVAHNISQKIAKSQRTLDSVQKV